MTSPGGGEPRTVDVPLGLPASSAVYTLPPGVTFDLEAVYVEVDASGAGDTTAELTLSEQSGVVIARKSQSQVIDGGSSGSATWALRLSDDGGGGSPAGVSARQIMSFTTPNNPAGTDGGAVFTNIGGAALFDAGAGVFNPPCLVAGTYTFVVYGQGNGNWNDGGSYNVQWQIMDTTGFSYFLYTLVGPFGAAAFVPGMSLTTANPMLAGDTFQLDWHNGDTAGAHTFGGTLWIVRTGG